jgi:hypothetical protein
MCRVVAVDDAKKAGVHLGKSRTSDVVDALVSLLVGHGDEVMTSDPGDVALLLRARSVDARVSVV